MSEASDDARPEPAGGFRRNAIVMVVGSAASQGLALAVMPVLTRIYPPEALGAQALFISAGAALTVVATLRFDLAVVLPREERSAMRLLALGLYQSLALAMAVVAVAVIASGELRRHFTPDVDSSTWVWLLGPLVLMSAALQLGQGMATRHGRFGHIVLSNVAVSAGFAVTATAIGVVSGSESGVVWGRALGQLAGVLALLYLGHLVLRQDAAPRRSGGVLRQWREQRQFILFNTPYSLIGALSRDLPIYVFSLGGGAALAASYAVARTVTLAPTQLVSLALSRVFYREAALHLGEPRLERLALALTRGGLAASCVPFAFLLVWGDELFSFAFGDQWEGAGSFAQKLAVPLWLALQTGWPERLFEAARKQNVSFSLQMGFDALHATTIVTIFVATRDAQLTVAGYAVTFTLYQVTYLVAVYRVAGFDLRPLVRALAWATAAFSAVSLGMILLRVLSPGGPVITMLCSGGAALAVAVALLGLRRRGNGAPRQGDEA